MLLPHVQGSVPVDRAHSVRAWRELRYNKKYAGKLEKKLARLKEKEAQQAKAAAGATKTIPLPDNPFAVSYAPEPAFIVYVSHY